MPDWLQPQLEPRQWALLVLLAVLGFWMLGAHNRITALRAAVLQAWGPVDAALTQRAQTLTALLAAVADALAGEQAALDAVAAAQAQVNELLAQVRRRPVQRDALAELSKADAVLAATLPRLLALIEHQPELPRQDAVRQALAALADLKGRLAFARQAFNEAGAGYNAAVAQFPTRLLAPVFNFGQAGRL